MINRLALASAAAFAVFAALVIGAPLATADETPQPVSGPTPTPTIEPGPDGQLPTPTPTPPPPLVQPQVIKPPASRLPLRAGATGWRVKELQDRLQWMGYAIYPANIANERMGESTAAAVKRFQSKFGYRPTGVVGPVTWSLLRNLSGKVGSLPKSCTEPTTAICVDKTQKLVRYVVRGAPRLTLDARFGFYGAETREGTFRVNSKSRDHYSSLYRTWMPFAMFFSGGQAVHYSPYFARDGYNGGSHGCVNLRDFDKARWLFDHVPVGTRVYVYRS